jgi:NADH-quinone oxidoreductase subunit L
MTFDFSYTIWIALVPFFIFLFLGLFGTKLKGQIAGYIGSAGLFASFIMSCFTAYQYFFVSGKVDGVYQKIIAFNTTWLNFTDKLHVDMGSLIDPISVMMLVVVSTVSLMVHIYSLGYMKGDPGFPRFYAFLSLFTFSMMGLVMATNIFQMYTFWELVGVSSFLLIGYYYEKPSAVAASKKAFIVTRFADFGFLIGILLVSYFTGTFDFKELTSPNGLAILSKVGGTFLGLSVVTWSMILVFMGGAGKSAMFPLHIWLPDAMEGPTPVSALIHAATMVVAGVYLVARMFPVYAGVAPDALKVVAYVGSFTSLFAAVIACTQFDIKRVLAFSTLSQIGYMMVALGVAGSTDESGLGFMASNFHLFTHAMFKALLFLGAGSIIHAVHSNYMYDMGGLWKRLPITHFTFLIAVLAISGIPPFAGFWSKDEILAACHSQNLPIYYVQMFVSGLTAFYMSRLYFSIFFGKNREYHHPPHEAPFTMTIPLIFLAIMSASVGLIKFGKYVTFNGVPHQGELEMDIAIPSVILAVLSIGLAALFYAKETRFPDKIAASLRGFYKAVYNKFYFDEIYLFVTKKIIFRYISIPVAWFDRHIVDGTMNGIASVTESTAKRIKGFQSGRMQQYAMAIVYGLILLVIVFVYIWK